MDRLSTVRNCDVIFVVQDGQVIEQGSHDELIANRDGAYSNLVVQQMNAQKGWRVFRRKYVVS